MKRECSVWKCLSLGPKRGVIDVCVPQQMSTFWQRKCAASLPKQRELMSYNNLLVLDRVKAFSRSPLIRRLSIALAEFMLLAVAMISLSASYAHDHNRPELNGWFRSLQSQGLNICCDGSDAKSIEDPDWENNSGRYRVRLEGQWFDVPDTAVVTVPNKYGRALVWPIYQNGYPIMIRCFMPGPLS